jgi:hypothetical protein
MIDSQKDFLIKQRQLKQKWETEVLPIIHNYCLKQQGIAGIVVTNKEMDRLGIEFH